VAIGTGRPAVGQLGPAVAALALLGYHLAERPSRRR
jgi:hypothetical protein